MVHRFRDWLDNAIEFWGKGFCAEHTASSECLFSKSDEEKVRNFFTKRLFFVEEPLMIYSTAFVFENNKIYFCIKVEMI